MHISSDYIQPLTNWLYDNPNWALFITFIISFGESLAIIGSIVPGSVTMTAIGILAGSGVMRVDLTLIAATLGAVAGDGASYFIGYTFRNSLNTIWPFSRYPAWLKYGQEYFAKHGGKSVLIGRFIGPLRSIIPVIAGMMKMKHMQFFFANVISAIGWSIVYIIPGVLIGAASTELSTSNARRLFIFVILILLVLWLMGLLIKWLLQHGRYHIQSQFNVFWCWLSQKKTIGRVLRFITPVTETEHAGTVGLLLTLLFCVVASTALVIIVVHESWAALINEPIYYLLQSLQTKSFTAFFIFICQFTTTIPLGCLYMTIAAYSIFHKDWRLLKTWFLLGLTTALIVYIISSIIPISQTSYMLRHNKSLLFPLINITFSTVFFSFLIAYISTRYKTGLALFIQILLISILLLSGIGSIYLSHNWLTGVIGAYLFGFTIFSVHWILFRRHNPMPPRSQLPLILAITALINMSCLMFLLNYNQMMQLHTPHQKQFLLSNTQWWSKTKVLSPIYSRTRTGKRASIFNVQYAGNIQNLQTALERSGWKFKTVSLMSRLIEKTNGNSKPLYIQLYKNQKPNLLFSYHSKKHGLEYILSFWRSNYYLSPNETPIWIGNISQRKKQPTQSLSQDMFFQPIISSLEQFHFKLKPVDLQNPQSLLLTVPPTILLIQEKNIE